MRNLFKRPELHIQSRDGEIDERMLPKNARQIVEQAMENDTDEHVLLDMENRTTEQRFRSEVAALEGWVLEAYDVSETQAHELAARIHCALDSGLGEMNSEQRELYRIDESTEDFVVGIR